MEVISEPGSLAEVTKSREVPGMQDSRLAEARRVCWACPTRPDAWAMPWVQGTS